MDPLSFAANWVFGRNYYFAGLNDQAIEKFDKLRSPLRPVGWCHRLVAWACIFPKKMNTERARREFDRVSVTDHNSDPSTNTPSCRVTGIFNGDHVKAKVTDSTLKKKAFAVLLIAQVYMARSL